MFLFVLHIWHIRAIPTNYYNRHIICLVLPEAIYLFIGAAVVLIVIRQSNTAHKAP